MPAGLIHYGEGAVLPDPFIIKNCGAVAVQELGQTHRNAERAGSGVLRGKGYGGCLRFRQMDLFDLKNELHYVPRCRKHTSLCKRNDVNNMGVRWIINPTVSAMKRLASDTDGDDHLRHWLFATPDGVTPRANDYILLRAS